VRLFKELCRFLMQVFGWLKTVSFEWTSNFWEKKKVSWGNTWWIWKALERLYLSYSWKLSDWNHLCAGALSWCKSLPLFHGFALHFPKYFLCVCVCVFFFKLNVKLFVDCPIWWYMFKHNNSSDAEDSQSSINGIWFWHSSFSSRSCFVLNS